ARPKRGRWGGAGSGGQSAVRATRASDRDALKSGRRSARSCARFRESEPCFPNDYITFKYRVGQELRARFVDAPSATRVGRRAAGLFAGAAFRPAVRRRRERRQGSIQARLFAAGPCAAPHLVGLSRALPFTAGYPAVPPSLGPSSA